MTKAEMERAMVAKKDLLEEAKNTTQIRHKSNDNNNPDTSPPAATRGDGNKDRERMGQSMPVQRRDRPH